MPSKPQFVGEKVKLGELLLDTFSGEWGTEEGESLIPVLRTSNFNEDGSFDYSTPAMRCIPERKVTKKRMVRGDIILEKSGGTPKRPVGIMAFYDSDALALCSNFNQVLRFDADRILPKFAFHQLRWLKDRNAFYRYTRKTTGLQNLQMNKLVELKLCVPQIEIQTSIAATLDEIVGNQRALQQGIAGFDSLAKSRFVEMFGGLSGYESRALEGCVSVIESGKSPKCLAKPREGDDPGVLRLSAISSGVYKEAENKALPSGAKVTDGKMVRDGDILLARKNTPELVGQSVLVNHTDGNIMFPDIVFRMRSRPEVDEVYLSHVLAHPLAGAIKSLAHGSAKSMSNIPKSKLAKLLIPLPPLAFQQEFAAFASQVDKSRFIARQQIEKLQMLYDKLAQDYFG